jgi:hypothetical protein
MSPVLEELASSEQAFEQGGSIPRDACGQHQVLIAFDGRHRVQLHGFQAADLLPDLIWCCFPPGLIAVRGEQVDRLEQEAANHAGAGLKR